MLDPTPFDKYEIVPGKDDLIDFYNMLDGFFNKGLSAFTGFKNDGIKVDLRENEHEYIVEAELAGFNKEDIKLDFKESKLFISASSHEDQEVESKNYIYKERFSNAVQRDIYLKNTSGENIKARFSNGILEVTVPKIINLEKDKKIEIL